MDNIFLITQASTEGWAKNEEVEEWSGPFLPVLKSARTYAENKEDKIIRVWRLVYDSSEEEEINEQPV